MAQKVEQQMMFCPNEGKPTLHYRNNKEMSWVMHVVLSIFTGGLWLIFWMFTAFFHVLTKPIAGKWTCSQCGGLDIPRTPQQNAQNTENLLRQMNYSQQEVLPEPTFNPEPELPPNLPPELPPAEIFAIDKNIKGGLIEFFGLQRWYEAVFDDEQKHRLENRFGTVSGNKLASGAVRFKFPNVDSIQFLYDLEEKLKPQAYSDVYKLVDEQFKIEAGKFCKIDETRWNNEKYYKSWFALMKSRINALNKLTSDNYFSEGQFDAVTDNFATQPCLDMSNQSFNILNGELDRAFDNHFFEPIEGCRCIVRGYRA